MASKVEVLCPNGHRVTVKTTPNTTVLQILEEACTKKGFDPSEYNIKHGRRLVDVTLTVRYAGLPNLAKLELVAVGNKRRAEQDVILALQLPDGSRLQHAFSPLTPLWEVLQHFDQDRGEGEKLCVANKGEGLHPVCVYMREEIIGEEALQSMILRKLGLTGGKAVIRYQQREVSGETLQQIHDKLEGEKRRAEQQAAAQAQRPAQPPRQANPPTQQSRPPPANPQVVQNVQALSDNAANQNRENQTLEMQKNAQATTTTSTTTSQRTVPSATLVSQTKTQMPSSKNHSAPPSAPPTPSTQQQQAAASAAATKAPENAAPTTHPTPHSPPPPVASSPSILSSGSPTQGASRSEPMPKQSTKRPCRATSPRLESTRSEPVEPVELMDTESATTSTAVSPPATASAQPRDAVDALNSIPGVQVFRPGELLEMNLSPEQERAARQMAQAMLQEMFGAGSSQQQQRPQRALQQRQQQNEFQNFKFPEATKGQNLYQNELSDVKKEDFRPCEREVVLYNKDAEHKAKEEEKMETDEDLPEEFFELTEADIRKLWADNQKQIREQADAPLMTEAMRRARHEERYSKYQRVVIRFHFPDRNIIQALFRPRETVYSLQKFVTEHLHDKKMHFHLYTAPPKTVLKDKYQNLIEAQLAPMSVVYVGFEDKNAEHYVNSAILAQRASEDQAAMVLLKHMQYSHESSTESATSPTPGTSGPSSSGQSAGQATGQSSQSSSSRTTQRSSTSSSGGKVPKWFKVGKK